MTHYAYELDICPAYAWQGGPSGDVHIDALKNKAERRIILADRMQHLFTLPFENISVEDYQTLKSVHAVMYGQGHSFLLKDWLDYTSGQRNRSTDRESLGVAPSGTTAVQLYKTYPITLPNGSVIATRTRDIVKPLSTVIVYQADGSGNPVAKTGSLNTETGLFTPSTAWTAGRNIWWAGEFRVPVRFLTEYMPMSIEEGNAEGHRVSGTVEFQEVFDE